MNPEDLAAFLGESDEDADEAAKWVTNQPLSPTITYVDVTPMQTL